MIPVGTAVSVQWSGAWHPAVILKREGRRYRVHYTGEPDAADEWVGKDRMRPPGGS